MSRLRARLQKRVKQWGLEVRCAKGLKKGDPARLDKTEVQELRKDVRLFLATCGISCDISCTPGQPFDLDILEGLLKALDDVDGSLPGFLRAGVPSGICNHIEASGVWHRPAKHKPTPLVDIRACEENWSSAEADPILTSELLSMEVKEGFVMEVRSNHAELQQTYGDAFAISKLAVIQAPGRDPRLVIDATASGLNGRAVFPEQSEYPTVEGVMEVIARHLP